MLVPLHPWMLASVQQVYNDGLYPTNNRAMHALSDAGVYAFYDAIMINALISYSICFQ